MATKREHSLWVFPETADAMVCTKGMDGGAHVPFDLFPAFDFEDEDGAVHWCVRQRLLGGDSEPIAWIFNGTGMTLLHHLNVDGHKLTDSEADGMQHEMAEYVAKLFALAPKMREFLRDLATDPKYSCDNDKIPERAAELLDKLTEDV